MNYTTREVYEFISQQTNDPIVERKTCTISGQPFPIYQSDVAFYEKVSPVFKGKKYQMPTPTLCPEERQRRRGTFRNERKLYNRKCDGTGKNIVCIYSPDKPYKVYDQAFRRSDQRDPMVYGKEFDFSKTFNEQFSSLYVEVPKLAVLATQNENSIYVNGAAYNKNCYLIFASDYNEDSLYSDNIAHCQDMVDSSNTNTCSNSYQLIGSNNCSNSKYCIDCHNSYDLLSCFDCKDCQFCCLSSGLRHKQYYFQNKPYSKEQYQIVVYNYLQEHTLSYLNSRHDAIYRASYGLSNENTFGNYVNNCKNATYAYIASWLENCKYIINGSECDNCQDSYVIVENSSLCYENVSSIGLHHCCFTVACWNKNSHLYYCDHCQWCNNLFGCVGLRNKEYCIFNKQYTKEAYEELVVKIIEYMKTTGERGEFFNPSYAPFGYNETIAQNDSPLLQSEATQRWYKWQEHYYDPVLSPDVQILKGNEIPRDISEVSDDILQKILICEVSWRPFRIVKKELQFYKKHDISLPRRHPDIRDEERNILKPQRQLCLRNCNHCNQQMLSVYPPSHTGKVYCNVCYEQEVS